MDKQIMYVDFAGGRNAYPAAIVSGDGSESYRVERFKTGRHNMCWTRWDMWYIKDGIIHHAVHMGVMNTVAHCRPTKRKSMRF